jgi:lipopolysaccharide transport system ATP-binding protein
LKVGFLLFNEDSELLLESLTTDGPEARWPRLEPGMVELRCALPRRFLNEGSYRLELHCSLHHREWITRPGQNSPMVHFEIQGGLSDSPYWTSARPGLLAPEWVWERTFDTCTNGHCPPSQPLLKRIQTSGCTVAMVCRLLWDTTATGAL